MPAFRCLEADERLSKCRSQETPVPTFWCLEADERLSKCRVQGRAPERQRDNGPERQHHERWTRATPNHAAMDGTDVRRILRRRRSDLLHS